MVWRYLAPEERGRGWVLLLVHPFTAPELLFQAWIVAMRRKFAQDVDPQLARNYVHAALRRRGAADVNPDTVVALVDLVLTAKSHVSLSRLQRSLFLPILQEIVDESSSKWDPAELVRAAEGRLVRRQRKAKRRLWLRGPSRTVRVAAPDMDSQPASIIGQVLRAQANYDRARVRALPRERSEEAAFAVVDAAFDIVVKERFSRGRSADMIDRFAQSVSASSNDPLLDAATVRSLVEGVFDQAVTVQESAAPPLELHGKILSFVRAVEDLGLYEREIDQMLRRAEQVSESRGVTLTPMPVGDFSE